MQKRLSIGMLKILKEANSNWNLLENLRSRVW